jgi:hypothetical protein
MMLKISKHNGSWRVRVPSQGLFLTNRSLRKLLIQLADSVPESELPLYALLTSYMGRRDVMIFRPEGRE